MSISVTVSADNVKSALALFARTVEAYSDVEAKRIAGNAHERITGERYFKNRTGETAKSFGSRPKRVGKCHYQVASSSVNAARLNVGTPPHIIAAVNARALRFFRGGKVTFAKSVRHPGTRAINFEERERMVAQPLLEQAAERAVKLAAKVAGL